VISREDVQHVALLSRLELSDQEIDLFAKELSAILDHVEQLQRLDLEGVEPLSHPHALQDVLREDAPRPSLDREQALANAPQRDDQGFTVPPVIGTGG